MRTLVIEDHVDSAEWVRALLEHRRHDVRVLFDGSQAMAKVSDHQPDLVLVDFMLPQTDGLQVLRNIHQEHPSVSVVVMTGHGSVSRAVEAMQAGALNFLEKPLELSHLIPVIEQAERRASLATAGALGADA